jgi:RimJ/RimL family protein N-acetyltransferase
MVGWDEQGLAGAVTLRYTAPRTIRLVNVITDHTRRGQGIGREFVRLALKMCFELMDAETVSLGVLAENERAVRCYRAAGFAPLPKEDWVTHTFFGRDWLCMEMAITREVYFDRKKADG